MSEKHGSGTVTLEVFAHPNGGIARIDIAGMVIFTADHPGVDHLSGTIRLPWTVRHETEVEFHEPRIGVAWRENPNNGATA